MRIDALNVATLVLCGPSRAPAVRLGILLLALAFRPQGLFGR